MKKIFLVLFVILPIFAFSHNGINDNKVEFKKNQLSIQSAFFNTQPNLENDIQHLRYCIGKYRKEKVTGIYLTLGGAFTAGLASGLYQYDVIDETTSSIVYLGGGVAIISGYVMQLTCNRWLKKAALSPADSGIGVKLSF